MSEFGFAVERRPQHPIVWHSGSAQPSNGAPGWSVSLQHDDDPWHIAGDEHFGVPKDAAIAALKQFIAEAHEALARLRRGDTPAGSLNATRPRFRVKLTDDLMSSVAAVYRAAPKNPTAAVQKHFNLSSDRTARFWVRTARDGGHLGKAFKGKGGEQ